MHRLRWLLGSGRTAVLALDRCQNLCIGLVRHTANFLLSASGLALLGSVPWSQQSTKCGSPLSCVNKAC